MKIPYSLIPALIATCSLFACSRKEQRQEDSAARTMGHAQAIELSATITRDTLEAETLILDIRTREAELRRRGAPQIADSYIEEFFTTLDSVNPSLAAELRKAHD